MEKQRGQILLIHCVSFILIVSLFIHLVAVSKGLLQKQESQLSADLVALSAARVEAETLHLIGILNDVMRNQARLMLGSLIAPILAATTVVGLPLVPHLVRVASQVVPRVIKSLTTLSQFQKKIIQSYSVLVTLQIWRVARANGFSGGLPTSKPVLPVAQNINKFTRDVINIFGFSKGSLSDRILRKIIKGKDPDLPVSSNPKKKSETEKTKKSISKLKKLRKKISPQKLFLAHYLNEEWVDHQINVICWDAEKNIRVSSARVTHESIAPTEEGLDDLQNNYVSRKESQDLSRGFQVELKAFPDYLKKLPQITGSLEKMETYLKKLPADIPLRNEHFKWIQH